MDITQTIALTMGVAWASGINLYAAILMLGWMGSTGNIDLPPDLQILTDPMVMLAAGFMYFVEFFADKVPGVDTGWDAIHTFIRIPAGAILAAAAIGDVTSAQGLNSLQELSAAHWPPAAILPRQDHVSSSILPRNRSPTGLPRSEKTFWSSSASGPHSITRYCSWLSWHCLLC